MPTSRDPGAHCNACPLENIQQKLKYSTKGKMQSRQYAYTMQIFFKSLTSVLFRIFFF